MTFTLDAALLQPIVALIRGYPDSHHSAHLELCCRYLSYFRGRDRLVATPSFRNFRTRPKPHGTCFLPAK
jgi:hypothetical protein